MNILVTGGAGFIGSHLVERLLQAEHTVYVLDDLSTGVIQNLDGVSGNKRLKVRIGSVLDADLVENLMRECESVYHLASAVGVQLIMNQPIDTIERIVLGTDIVLKYASRYRCKTLIASSSEVYGKSNDVPFTEDGDRVEGPTYMHRWAYAAAKAMDEFMGLAHAKTTGLPVVVARLFNTVGPRQSGQYGMVLPRFCRAALAGDPLYVYGDGRQTRCFAHVLDIIKALQGLMDADHTCGEVFNVGTDEEIPIMGLAELVVELAGTESAIRTKPYEEVYPTGGFEDMLRRVPCVDKIAKAIGWRPTRNLRQIVSDVLAFEKAKFGRSGSAR